MNRDVDLLHSGFSGGGIEVSGGGRGSTGERREEKKGTRIREMFQDTESAVREIGREKNIICGDYGPFLSNSVQCIALSLQMHRFNREIVYAYFTVVGNERV